MTEEDIYNYICEKYKLEEMADCLYAKNCPKVLDLSDTYFSAKNDVTAQLLSMYLFEEVDISSWNIKEIGNNMFYKCSNLKKVHLNNTVKTINDSAFYSCSSLDIKLPESVETIGQLAFYRCNSLSENVFSSGIKHIGKFAFQNCINFKNVILPNNLINIDMDAFSTCTNLETIFIPKSVTHIGYSAFSACPNLKYLITPKGNAKRLSSLLYDDIKNLKIIEK